VGFPGRVAFRFACQERCLTRESPLSVGNRFWSWVVRKYWHIEQGRYWAFRCRQKDFWLCRHDRTVIVRHVKVRHTRSPFDGDWLYWSARLGRHPGVPPGVARLLKKQRGKCPWCGLFFRHGDVWNVDHIAPKSQGGTDATENLQLLHRHCHLRKHGKSPCSGVGGFLWHRCTPEIGRAHV